MVLNILEAGLIGSVIFLAYLLWRYPNSGVGTSRSTLPRPGTWESFPLIGEMFAVLRDTPRSLEYQLKWQLEGRVPATFTFPGRRFIVVTKPEWIEYIGKTNFPNFVKGEDFQLSVMRDMLGMGIFSTDGDQWNRQRKASSHIFSAGSFRTVIGSSIDEHVGVLTEVLKGHAKEGKVVALNEEFFRFTLDSFVKMSFGVNLDSLRAGKPVPFATAFDFAQGRLDERFFRPAWPITEKFSATGRKMREAIRTVDEFSYGIIDERDRQGEKGAAETDLLALYRNIRDEKGQGMSRKELRDAVLNLILAGRDTTAQALSWTFYYIARNPALLEPIRKEIKELGDHVNYDTYRSYIQTNALFHEVLRLHPSVPKNAKKVLQDDQLPNGPKLHAGDIVAFSDWVMARDPEVWGEDCCEMKPERWIDEKGQLRKESQWRFHAFNGGPRLCLGQNLATYESVAVIACLARNFDITLAPGYLENTPMATGVAGHGSVPSPLYATSLTLPMKHPLLVNVAIRSEA